MRRFLLAELAAFFLLIFVYNAIVRSLLAPIVQLPALLGGIAVPLTLALFSLFHAVYLLGWRHALVFAASSVVISWSFEQFGVATGLIYGNYHYTAVLGVKLGHVPLIIPAAWFMMMYPCHVMANLIGNGRPICSSSGLLKAALFSLLTAAIMTTWDLAMDPVLSGPEIQAWIWEKRGAYYGVPLQNFAGWIFTAFAIDFLYRLVVQRVGYGEIGEFTPAISFMPMAAYTAMMIATAIVAGTSSAPPIVFLTAGFVVVGIVAKRLINGSFFAPA